MNPDDSVSTEEFVAGLARVERLARFTDTGLRIPFTDIRFGVDPLLGLIPVVGDFAGLGLSLYIYHEARNLGAPRRVRMRMLRNMGVDLVGGFLPVVGDVFDFAWRANNRNAHLLLDWARKASTTDSESEALAHGGWWILAFALAAGGLLYFFYPGGLG